MEREREKKRRTGRTHQICAGGHMGGGAGEENTAGANQEVSPSEISAAASADS